MKLNDRFKPLLTSKSRYIICTGGRGSGKSFAVTTYSNTLTFDQYQKILFTRFTLTSAKVSIIPEFLEKLELMECAENFHITSDSIINSLTLNQILFRGIKTSSGNQTANLKSLQGVTTWILDEAEELVDEDIFDKIDLSIRHKGVQNRIIIILNPASKEHWIYKRFFEGKVNEGFNGTIGDTTYIHTTYKDNLPNLSKQFLKRIEEIKDNNPEKYKHVILGGWLDKAEGVIFNEWELSDFPDITYIFGLDFGWSPDPCGLVKVGINKDSLYIEECFYLNNLSTDEIEEQLNKHVKKNELIVADNAEPRLINELYDKGFNIIACKKGKDSITNGIATMKNYKIFIKGDNLVKEMNNYCWNNRKASIPVDDYNHLIDPTRYALTELTHGKDFFIV